MTDATGIFQHSIGARPDLRHGYCTDDNARLLEVAATALAQGADEARLFGVAGRFLLDAYNPAISRFRNFRSADGLWLDDGGSNETQGRAIQGLATAVACRVSIPPASGLRALLDLALESPVISAVNLRPLAYVALGLHRYLGANPDDARALARQYEIAGLLGDACGDPSPVWPWPEAKLTYENGRIPAACISAGLDTDDPALVDAGVDLLHWLFGVLEHDGGGISLVGNQGWYQRDGFRARFDQQPVEIIGLVEAAGLAFRLTGERLWLERARRSYGWLFGDNDRLLPLYDEKTGGCFDGLLRDGVNTNMGAESVLTLHRATQVLRDLEQYAR